MALYNERVEDLTAISQQRDDVKKQYDEWRKKRYKYSFMRCVSYPSSVYPSN